MDPERREGEQIPSLQRPVSPTRQTRRPSDDLTFDDILVPGATVISLPWLKYDSSLSEIPTSQYPDTYNQPPCAPLASYLPISSGQKNQANLGVLFQASSGIFLLELGRIVLSDSENTKKVSKRIFPAFPKPNKWIADAIPWLRDAHHTEPDQMLRFGSMLSIFFHEKSSMACFAIDARIAPLRYSSYFFWCAGQKISPDGQRRFVRAINDVPFLLLSGSTTVDASAHIRNLPKPTVHCPQFFASGSDVLRVPDETI
jgi:hypothetical protein